MAPVTVLLALLPALFSVARSAPLGDALKTSLDLGSDLENLLPFPFPFPFCSSTTTVTLGATHTVTSTVTIHSTTSTTTVTAAPVVSVTRLGTTIYTPTEVSCISTATTFAPYTAPLGKVAAREAAHKTSSVPDACSIVPTITIIPPTITGKPCTCVTGEYDIITSTTTVIAKGTSTITTTPTTVITKTETWIQPTPTAYAGINYYQYLNGYDYNHNTNGLGGGGYDTADWNGNYSYYTSGLTRNIDFASSDWPNGPAVCQLPGQATVTDCSQWTVVFQGFLYALTPGNYTVFAPTSGDSAEWQDNSGFWWGGQKAYSSYSDNNVDGGATAISVPGVPNSFDYSLTAGEFLPMTFIYSNGQGPAANRITITSPNGTVYPTSTLNLFVPPCPDSPFVP